jgi:hypothetical protein
MADPLNQINQVPGVLAVCFVDRKGGFSKQPAQRELPREKVERALRVLTQSLEAMGEGAKARTKSLVINTASYRLFLQNLPEGTVFALCSAATDLGVLRKSLEPGSASREIGVSPRPTVPAPSPPKSPVVEPKPVSAPPAIPVPRVEEKPVPATILDEIYSICEEELGDLALTIFENQEADSKIREGALSRERVLKFCLALQKDAGMIIGPKASLAMADRMLAKLI